MHFCPKDYEITILMFSLNANIFSVGSPKCPEQKSNPVIKQFVVKTKKDFVRIVHV